MSVYTSFQCNGMETLFLFEILNIPEAGQLRSELHDAAGRDGEPAPSYAQLLKGLVQDHVVDVSDQEITIEPQVHRLLMGCKLSSAVMRLELINTKQGRSVTYGFLSSDQLVEWIWEPVHHQSVFTSFLSIQEMFQVLGNRLDIDDSPQEAVLDPGQEGSRTSIGGDTLRRLFELEISPEETGNEPAGVTEKNEMTDKTEKTQFILQEDKHLDQTWVQPLSCSLAALERHGRFEVYTRGTDERSQVIYFIGSASGNWLFLEGETENLFTPFIVTEEELVQSLFLLTTRSISVLPHVR
ncbi:hypothetical protein GCM10008014_53750 [Paenibacillus silvae]|uniref:ESX secretion-associated protein EspG n=1 Tax=Paenibacillus silvae TaxID=1325358 RepID=A0ABQ1ZN29_9BACL|nr:hypothetical protein [Paenibacillus silvae]GGH69887.1 hypothetical protein GCM10008014_53750 [Paenibacillus silvae]